MRRDQSIAKTARHRLARTVLAICTACAAIPAQADALLDPVLRDLATVCGAPGFDLDQRAASLTDWAAADADATSAAIAMAAKTFAANAVLSGSGPTDDPDKLAAMAAKGITRRIESSAEAKAGAARVFIRADDPTQMLMIDLSGGSRVEQITCSWSITDPAPDLLDDLMLRVSLLPGQHSPTARIWRASDTRKLEKGHLQFSRALVLHLDAGQTTAAVLRFTLLAQSF